LCPLGAAASESDQASKRVGLLTVFPEHDHAIADGVEHCEVAVADGKNRSCGASSLQTEPADGESAQRSFRDGRSQAAEHDHRSEGRIVDGAMPEARGWAVTGDGSERCPRGRARKTETPGVPHRTREVGGAAADDQSIPHGVRNGRMSVTRR